MMGAVAQKELFERLETIWMRLPAGEREEFLTLLMTISENDPAMWIILGRFVRSRKS
jgi:hypothetical protein